MENWRKDARREPIIVDLEALVPKDHLLWKIEKVMDYGWLYERLDPYYCHDNGRPGADPVVLIKMVLIQHLFGIPSLRQTYRETQVNNAYRWFLGYGLLDNIPHFATVSYAFCQRFPDELTSEIFEHILNKALNKGGKRAKYSPVAAFSDPALTNSHPRLSPRSCGEKTAVFDTFPCAPIAKAGTRPSVYPLAASPLLFLLISRPRWACPLPPRSGSHPSPRR